MFFFSISIPPGQGCQGRPEKKEKQNQATTSQADIQPAIRGGNKRTFTFNVMMTTKDVVAAITLIFLSQQFAIVVFVALLMNIYTFTYRPQSDGYFKNPHHRLQVVGCSFSSLSVDIARYWHWHHPQQPHDIHLKGITLHCPQTEIAKLCICVWIYMCMKKLSNIYVSQIILAHFRNSCGFSLSMEIIFSKVFHFD